MNRGATTKMSRLLVQQLGQRYFSSSSSTTSYSVMNIGISKISRPIGTGWARISMLYFQNMSTLASGAAPKEEKAAVPPLSSTAHGGSDGGDKKGTIVSYWGVSPPQLTNEDGSPWRWNCFRPWETYKADVNIDVKKHHTPSNITDKIAFWTVEVLKFNTRLFFQKRHMCHAVLLETVAAVPGMVGGMLLHCKSLRKFEHSGGWIKLLLEEAENERMHLMTFIEMAKPKWYERALVFTVQGLFVNAYFLAYVASPKLAHRICGYLEEEAVNSYTEFLNDLDKGLVENVPAPAIAIDYWRLPPNSTLRDVVTVIRADEAHHRDINHFASDIHTQGHELRDYAAPLNYH